MQTDTQLSHKLFSMIDQAGQTALNASGPEESIAVLMQACYETLGDREAHSQPGALKSGEHQYFVAGAFFVSPDTKYHMLTGSVGFPAEQQRLMIPIDGGHPGHVFETKQKLILKNTDEHGAFRQYLKSSRMGSALYAPMIWQGTFIGQLLVAAQARNTMRDIDLDALVAVARLATALWIASGGTEWMTNNYPPANGFYAGKEGVNS
jgi:hypothetical protein